MVTEALLVGLLMFLGMLTDTGLGDPMIKRPLVMGALTGLVLGDLQTGVITGASLEVIFLGITSIGGALPSDSFTGSIFGTAFAILSGEGIEVAMALAVPISLLATTITTVVNIGFAAMMPQADRFNEDGNQKGIAAIHLACMILKPLAFGVVGFLGIMLGAEAVSTFIDSIPDVIMNGLTVAGQALPALGMAMLLNMLWDKQIAIFLFLGFVLYAYLELPLIAICLIGTVIAVYTSFKEMDFNNTMKNHSTSMAVGTDDEEDFFND
ncbi:MAG: PTS sugar transporter subunit IIC [Lachnospiraceae bacterium]|nr:PTS sugar transporter subunit IIC [Lachnospiraceae bacterium]